MIPYQYFREPQLVVVQLVKVVAELVGEKDHDDQPEHGVGTGQEEASGGCLLVGNLEKMATL